MTQYLRIEATRFRDYISFDVRVPKELQSCPIPSLLLQPLVENAIKHGVVAHAEQLSIQIRAEKRENFLVVDVRNSGQLPSADGPLADAHRGAGLRIVRDRVKARYPTERIFRPVVPDAWVIARVSYDPSEDPRAHHARSAWKALLSDGELFPDGSGQAPTDGQELRAPAKSNIPATSLHT